MTSTRQTTRWWAIIAILAALALVGAACANDTEGEPTQVAQEEAEEHMDEAEEHMDEAEEHMDDGGHMEEDKGHHDEDQAPVEIPEDAQMLEVEATELMFTPARLRVKAGEPVAVTVSNVGAAEHDWTIHDADGEEITFTHLQPGETGTAVFTVDAGTYQVWCTVPGHKEGGMTGKVIAA